ncbi:MAG TPA: outer membrane beta-barrel protein [Blastocatellia bacterium]|nr:outer membrane beta-barrel protein [Blastocatellia bacterium]
MKVKMISAAVAVLLCAISAAAQQNEVSLTVGAMRPGKVTLAPSTGITGARAGTSFALQAGYSTRFLSVGLASLYFDFPLAVTPKTTLDTSNALSVRSYSSLFFTPGVKLKALPLGKVSPYAVAGIGLARLNPGDSTSGTGNLGSQIVGAYSLGGGVDVKVAPFVSLRGEVRDYTISKLGFDIDLLKKRQHNVFVTAGVVLRF